MNCFSWLFREEFYIFLYLDHVIILLLPII
jgi:hypothetical protein